MIVMNTLSNTTKVAVELERVRLSKKRKCWPDICLVRDTFTIWECLWWWWWQRRRWFLFFSYCCCQLFFISLSCSLSLALALARFSFVLHSQLIYGRQKSISRWCVPFNCVFFIVVGADVFLSFEWHSFVCLIAFKDSNWLVCHCSKTLSVQQRAQTSHQSHTESRKIVLHKSQLFARTQRVSGANWTKKYAEMREKKNSPSNHLSKSFVYYFSHINLGSFLIAFQYSI